MVFARFLKECLFRENIVPEVSLQEFDFMSSVGVRDSGCGLEEIKYKSHINQRANFS